MLTPSAEHPSTAAVVYVYAHRLVVLCDQQAYAALVMLYPVLQYYADDPAHEEPEDFDANRAALGLRTRPRKVHSTLRSAMRCAIACVV